MRTLGLARWSMSAMALAIAAMAAGTGCKTQAIDPFPASGAVTGWEKSSETREFEAKDLWQYIDGDSDQYLQAGVVSASTSDYHFEGRLAAVVDVYTMGDSAGARKMLNAEFASDCARVSLGDAGVMHDESVAFRKGPYLVRIVAYSSTPDATPALIALAHGIEAKL